VIIDNGPFDWSDEINRIYQLLQSPSITTRNDTEKNLEKLFTSLRLHNQRISVVDEDILAFQNVEELSFTGNFLSEIDHVPEKVRTLHLNANR
jgi:hypothetical protein